MFRTTICFPNTLRNLFSPSTIHVLLLENGKRLFNLTSFSFLPRSGEFGGSVGLSKVTIPLRVEYFLGACIQEASEMETRLLSLVNILNLI